MKNRIITLAVLITTFISITLEAKMKRVTFKSEGIDLVGNLYYPNNFEEGKQYPTIIVSGSWTTVKEQMSGLYGQKFAKNGYIALAYDPTNYGESGGEPRFYENTSAKIQDIKNAVTYLQTLPEVNNAKIAAFGVCAGSMYTLIAAAEDTRIKAVVTAASWLHDAEAVKLFYGGEEGVQGKIKSAQDAKKKYSETGEMEYIETISTTNEKAAMYGNFDYYLNPKRGAVKEWSNDKFAVATWEDWLTLDPMPYAEKLNTSILMIHSDGCVLPQYTKNFYEKIGTEDKNLIWVDTELVSPMQQFNFYDQDLEVNLAITEACKWFNEKL